MCKCIKTGKELPDRSNHFMGHECRESDRFYCKYYSHNFVDGTNCILLRRPVNVRAILGIDKKEA